MSVWEGLFWAAFGAWCALALVWLGFTVYEWWKYEWRG